jgi:hypothetical protein
MAHTDVAQVSQSRFRVSTEIGGTKINGGTFRVPVALGSITFHRYGDFLMHDVGTGDGGKGAAADILGSMRLWKHPKP